MPQFEIIQDQECARIRWKPTGEKMHPLLNPLEEARKLYVEQLGWQHSDEKTLTVWDVGLGAGHNALAMIEWAHTTHTQLRLYSFDRSLEPLALSFKHPEFFTEHQCPAVSGLLKAGRYRDSLVEWDFIEGDFWQNLKRAPRPERVLYDPFSWKTNSEFWQADTLQCLHSQLPGPTRLITYATAGWIRLFFLQAGFWVARGAAVGRRKQSTLVATHPELLPSSLLVDARWFDELRGQGVSCPAECQRIDWTGLERHPQLHAARLY